MDVSMWPRPAASEVLMHTILLSFRLGNGDPDQRTASSRKGTISTRPRAHAAQAHAAS